MSSYINQDVEKHIATVNGEKINFNIFKKMYFLEREKQKKILGKNFFKLQHDQKFTQKTYNYILSQLINNVLLEQYAKKMHLQVSDNEVKEIILNSPIFQKNRKFNKEKYFNYLASANLTNHEYINIIKRKINTENLIRTIANSNFILENEKNNIIRLLSQKRIIKKSIIKSNSLMNQQNITNIEARNYFNQNKNNFYIPEKFKINYIQLNAHQFKSDCKNREIYEWYFKNIKKFSIKEKRRYSIIQTKTRNAALLILSRLHQRPEDFSKIAREQSTDPISSKKNGDIGWISIDLIPDEIKNANLHHKNQISNIIPFRNEFLIIQLNDILVKPPRSINEVFNTIKNEIKYQKSLNLYNKLKNKISYLIKENPNQIKSILKQNNISVQETNWFDKNSIPKVLNTDIIKSIIFNKELSRKNKNLKSKLYFVLLKNNQSFLIKIKDFQNKKKQNFENVKKNIIKILKFEKSMKEIKQKSEKIIDELKKGKTSLFKKYNLYFSNSEIISRYDDNPITPIVFSLPYPNKERKIYTLYQDKNQDFIIIKLEKIFNTKFSQKEKDIVNEYLERNNTEIIFNSILKSLHEKAVITYEKIEKNMM